jgi:hypothetical protein
LPRIEDFFIPKRGKGGYIEDLKEGDTPLISATVSNNGVVGFVNIKPPFKAPAITVERVTGTAFVQTAHFATVPDDVTVLLPKEEMKLSEFYIVASIINNSRWRFCFGRKLTPTRLRKLVIPPLDRSKLSLPKPDKVLIRNGKAHKKHALPLFKRVQITELFKPLRGDFHAIDKLKEGKFPTVSRVSDNNGIVGYFQKPKGAYLYPALTLTVSSVTGDAFVQPDPFIATDNVIVLAPKRKFKLHTLFFIQMMINRERWRCTYGRQLYKEKFSKTELDLPYTSKNELDEEYIGHVMQNSTYWGTFEKYARQYAKSNGWKDTILA